MRPSAPDRVDSLVEGSGRATLVFAIAMMAAAMLSGCIGEAEPNDTLSDPARPNAPLPTNVTMAVDVSYSGDLGTRVCVMMTQFCMPFGGLSGASQNPYTIMVNGTPQAVSLKIEWSAAGAAANSDLVAIVYAVQGTGGQGGFGGGGRELGRQSGTSPLTVTLDKLDWAEGEGRLRITLQLPSRTPSPSYVALANGQAFSVTGNYTTLVPVEEPAPAAMGSNFTRPA